MCSTRPARGCRSTVLVWRGQAPIVKPGEQIITYSEQHYLRLLPAAGGGLRIRIDGLRRAAVIKSKRTATHSAAIGPQPRTPTSASLRSSTPRSAATLSPSSAACSVDTSPWIVAVVDPPSTSRPLSLVHARVSSRRSGFGAPADSRRRRPSAFHPTAGLGDSSRAPRLSSTTAQDPRDTTGGTLLRAAGQGSQWHRGFSQRRTGLRPSWP